MDECKRAINFEKQAIEKTQLLEENSKELTKKNKELEEKDKLLDYAKKRIAELEASHETIGQPKAKYCNIFWDWICLNQKLKSQPRTADAKRNTSPPFQITQTENWL